MSSHLQVDSDGCPPSDGQAKVRMHLFSSLFVFLFCFVFVWGVVFFLGFFFFFFLFFFFWLFLFWIRFPPSPSSPPPPPGMQGIASGISFSLLSGGGVGGREGVHMSILWSYVMGRVRLTVQPYVLRGKTFAVGHYTQSVQLNVLIPVLLKDTIDSYF